MTDYYELLGVERTADADAIKKAYYKRAMRYHPDKITTGEGQDKDAATAKFQELSHAYQVLSDARLRQIYDQTGSVENDEVNAAKDGDGRDWEAYWRELFPPVTQAAVAQFEAQYKGSAEEADDLARAYEAGQGDMAHILENVYFGTVDQEQRYRDVLQPLIDAGTLKAYRAFTHETKAKRDARVRKAKREAAEAEAMASEINLKTDDDLKAIIQKRGEARMDSLLASLEAKYGDKGKGKGSSSKKKGSSASKK